MPPQAGGRIFRLQQWRKCRGHRETAVDHRSEYKASRAPRQHQDQQIQLGRSGKPSYVFLHIRPPTVCRRAATKPNSLLWTLTMNGLSMSKDYAQRSVMIELGRPTYSATWEEDSNRYIDLHRWEIIADIAAFFREPARSSKVGTRWQWEKEVLARLPDFDEAQAVILERQGAADADSDDAGELEDYFFNSSYSSSDMTQWWTRSVLPNHVAVEWFEDLTEPAHDHDGDETYTQPMGRRGDGPTPRSQPVQLVWSRPPLARFGSVLQSVLRVGGPNSHRNWEVLIVGHFGSV